LTKKIAIISNHILSPDRIGGMEHFYKRFDDIVKQNDTCIDWYFTDYNGYAFLKDLTIFSADGNTVEETFLRVSKEQQKEYDIIYTHFTALCSPYYKKIARQFPKAKIIAVDHNPRPIEGFSKIKKMKNLLKSLLYSKYIAIFIAVSEYSERHLIKDFTRLIQKKIRIIYNGIDTEKYRKKEDFSGTHNFIVTSHLRKVKGIQDIIEAVHRLPQATKEKVRVSVYGEGPYESMLKNMVSEYQLDTQITFKGSVDDLHLKYANYDYLLHASYGETFCYSVVESLISHVPVVTTNNHGNVLKLVEDHNNGFLFNAGDVVKLSEIIEDIVTSKVKINKQAFKNSPASEMTIDNMVEGYFKLIEL
jgi:glycosyltransferase involved in cell wall biosynthesis